ncbi:RloB family protein [Amycolatopsis benzoatilytica]|uniref:RloB family protein n=1 Tax=Amycolatopsis benzoatilytica TaxID=346045 RepID=UPI000A02D8AD|nr:RloB family protein [Amycolatopsis benzoatilytica]
MTKVNARKRRVAYRQPRSLILLVSGGENTEPDYFNGLRRKVRNPAVKVVIKDKIGDPLALVRHAAKIRSEDDYDEVWCVVDVDEFQLDAAVTLARKLGVNLAVSNPCFEYWLLLHFDDCKTPMANYKQVENKLKKHVKDYNKKELKFEKYAAGIDDAVARAKERCPEGQLAHECNPSTSVWRLVVSIM